MVAWLAARGKRRLRAGRPAAWVAGLLVAALTVAGPAPMAVAAPPPPPVGSPSAILVDAATGKVLFARNPNQERPIASVTKLMTLYLAVRAIDQGKVRLNEWVPISEAAYRVNGSQIWLEPGEQLTVDQLLRAIAVGSANDAAYALAEFLSGSEAAFVARMNQTAARLGMRHTHFANAHGLSAPDHYSTAWDLARLAQQAVRYPLLLHYTAMREDRSIRNGKGGHLWLINHNRLLGRLPGLDGLKTGYTREAGYCLVATAKRGDTRLIAVVLGAGTSQQRFDDAAALLSWGFAHYRSAVLVRKGQELGTVAVRRGIKGRIAAVAGASLFLTVEREDGGQAGGRWQSALELPREVEAPVRAGQVLGHLTIRQGGHPLGTVPVVAAEGVPALGWPQAIGRAWLNILRPPAGR